MVIVRGRYKPVERILLVLSIYFAYPISAFLARPDWKLAIHDTIVPQFNSDPGYLIMIVGLIGTTITPWMQFYLQASIVEKGVTKRDYNLSRIDVIFGCVVTDVIAFFIVVACAATIFHTQHPEIDDVAEAAQGAGPVRGQIRNAAVCRGLDQRLADVGRDPATRHFLQRLRGHGIRIRGGQEIRRGEDFLFPVYVD